MDRRYQEAVVLLDETVYAMINHRRFSGTEGNDLLVIKEAMRLYPPVTDLSREAIQDCEGGYFIPKGTTLTASQWVMHRHPRYFYEPEVFNPERWANDLEKQLPRGVYFPFGDGPRICIGKSFAVMEAVLILATIAQEFQLDLVPDQIIELQPSITLRPKHGIQVVLKKPQLLPKPLMSI